MQLPWITYAGGENNEFDGTRLRRIYSIKSFCDFLYDDIEKAAQANIIATIADGEEEYKA